ncbi:MAG: BON domain-containing protein [Planctomycetia bacterium]|nr:BON domain-containing protein [Planctomycetia bacterium]
MSFAAMRETIERRSPMRLRRLGGVEPSGRDAAAQEEVVAHLRASPYAEVRRIRCDVREGVAVLNGRLSSFFQRQMAIAAVRRAGGVDQIRDELEVQAK